MVRIKKAEQMALWAKRVKRQENATISIIRYPDHTLDIIWRLAIIPPLVK
jgi:hypothetical protein